MIAVDTKLFSPEVGRDAGEWQPVTSERQLWSKKPMYFIVTYMGKTINLITNTLNIFLKRKHVWAIWVFFVRVKPLHSASLDTNKEKAEPIYLYIL